MSCFTDLFLAFLAILFPPIAVWIKVGICTVDSLINIALCFLGFIPGLLHAWYIIAKYPEPEYEYETIPGGDGGESQYHGGHVTYYYVSQQPSSGQHGGQQQQGGGGQEGGMRGSQQKYPGQQPQGQGMHYGTVGGSSSAGDGQQHQQQQSQEGEGQGVPPSYDQAIKGDNKVQLS